jgi:threonine/homoserine/homoserine lactone efflux protein
VPEWLGVLLRGIVLGFAIAAPVGPIGLMCIRRTLQHGPAMGMATGLGAAVADTFYGAVAAFGLQAVIDWMAGHESLFRLFGGIFMLAVALKGMLAARPRPRTDGRPDPVGMAANFATGFVLTMGNPLTIMAFVAVFAAFGLGGQLGRFDAATLVAGVFVGAAAWWLLLNSGVAVMRHRITDRWFAAVNRIAAALLAACGLYALATAFR